MADVGITTAAGVFGADRHDDLEAGRNDIQPLGVRRPDRTNGASMAHPHRS